jgi:RNA polymerase-associated protein LEO1
LVFLTDFALSTDTVIMQARGQNIRAHSVLQRKREKVNRKYTQPARPRRQLSPGFLEDALDEVGF